MKQSLQLRVEPRVAYDAMALKVECSTRLNADINRIKDIKIRRRSIDARQRRVMVNLSVDVWLDESAPAEEPLCEPLPSVAGKPQAIVVGAGPAGLFAALTLIKHGIRPIVLERGKDVDSRRKDMARLAREGVVDPDSNYCFGEGGAGAYSDGKLYTRSKKRGPVDEVLRTFVCHGASPDILVDAHPHIGTDKLPEVIKSMREAIIAAGGEVRFSTKVTSINLDSEGNVSSVATADGNVFHGPVILATGHSAREIYEELEAKEVAMKPKGIAVGVRLEHPQTLIDSIMYHNPNGRGKYLPAAEYSMLERVDDRGVYSFCMCPGGFVIPSASAPGQMVVNGMSPSSRGTKWANSGMVVEVLPEDLPDYDRFGNLKMMHWQEDIERKFFEAGDGSQKAPAQRMTDFVEGRDSHDLPESSYAPGLYSARVDKLLPEPVSRRLREGFKLFGKKYRGFLTSKATVIGDETRTSAPVQISRDPGTLASLNVGGLYPCGEGAGYAGGIVSAAIDGIRCAKALALNSPRPSWP